MASKAVVTNRDRLPSATDLSVFDVFSAPDSEWAQGLLDSSNVPVLFVDIQQTVRVVNDAMCKLLGRKSLSLLGKHLNDVMIATRELSEVDYDLAVSVAQAYSESRTRELGPFLLSKRIGKTDPVSLTLQPHGHKGQKIVGCAVTVQAVTPEETEQKLIEAMPSLVSHELRTPLHHIKGFVSSLLQTDVEWDEETRLDFLQTIDHEADRLTHLVDDLLDISALKGGTVPLTLEKSDPYMLVHQGIDEASPYIGQYRIKVDVPEDLPIVKIDTIRLVMVIVNLLQNAARHSEPGASIKIAAKSVGNMVQFTVQDEGPGVPAEQRQDIFDLFYHGKKSTTNQGDKTAGTGLGLAVSRASIEAHGGQIWVDDNDEPGASFSFTVPHS